MIGGDLRLSGVSDRRWSEIVGVVGICQTDKNHQDDSNGDKSKGGNDSGTGGGEDDDNGIKIGKG